MLFFKLLKMSYLKKKLPRNKRSKTYKKNYKNKVGIGNVLPNRHL